MLGLSFNYYVQVSILNLFLVRGQMPMDATSTMSELKDVMRDLLLRGRFSDMEILCQGITFKVHQAIVCTQSSYFYSAMCDGFKVYFDRKR